ncbi:oligosaccharide flippase family protein [Rhodococcus rhodochrous]|uniref:oligosaccharide flippase family protein n=1 Tax=Rhodococcus rhodochrous TaxID=1829 RepID=UPI001E4EA411|nr:oligosaccharide flippase family protein [Rhodococcus rhodochrous]MCB8910111.1 oligosaccharide flippase family protein [Rhodococcus rhodochrous]
MEVGYEVARGRGLAIGSLYGLASQGATFFVQFGYSAITSRIVDASGFGAYAIALAASGLFIMLGTAGIGQAAMLLSNTQGQDVRALCGLATINGLVAGGVLVALAPTWANAWGAPEAAPATSLIAISVLIAPYSVLVSGIARREGRFQELAIVTVIANLSGMALGLVAVLEFRNSAALTVSSISTQAFIPLFLQIKRRSLFYPRFHFRSIRNHLPFTSKVLVFGILGYLGRTIPRFGVTRFLGPDVLGNWNRAEVLTSVPLQTVETALVQVIYPEFRHDAKNAGRAYENWSNMLVLVAWVSLPLSAFGAIAAVHLIPVLFGDGWQLACSLAPAICLAAGLQMPGNVLSSGLQALDHQRQTWRSELLVVLLQICAVGALAMVGSIWFAMFGLVLAPMVRHLSDVCFAHSHHLLDTIRLIRGYTGAIIATIAVLLFYMGISEIAMSGLPTPIRVLLPIVVLASASLGLWMARMYLPPVIIAYKYSIIPQPKVADARNGR